MSRKRTRRKHYALINPIALAIDGARTIGEDRLANIRALEQVAIEAFRSGAATTWHWRAIADMSNLAQALCEEGVGAQEVLPVALDVERHLGEAHERYLRTGRIGTTGPGLQAFRDLQEYHDLQRTSIDLSSYERAVVKTMNRIRSAHPSVKVCVGDTDQPKKEPA